MCAYAQYYSMDEMDFNQNESEQEEEQARAAEEAATKQQMQREQENEQQQVEQMQRGLSEDQQEMDEETEEEMEQSDEEGAIDEGEPSADDGNSEYGSGQPSHDNSASRQEQSSQNTPTADTPQQENGTDLNKQFEEQLKEARENGLDQNHDVEKLQKQFDDMENGLGNSAQKQMIKELSNRNKAFDEQGIKAYDGIEEKAQSIGRVGTQKDLQAAQKRMVENPQIGEKEARERLNMMKKLQEFSKDAGVDPNRNDVSKNLSEQRSQIEHDSNVQSMDKMIEQWGSSLQPGEKSDKLDLGDNHYMQVAKDKDGSLDVLVDGKSVTDPEKAEQAKEGAVAGKETYSRSQTLDKDNMGMRVAGMKGGEESYTERDDGSAEYKATLEPQKQSGMKSIYNPLGKNSGEQIDVSCKANKDGSYDLSVKQGEKSVTTHFENKEEFEKTSAGKYLERRIAGIQENDPNSPLHKAEKDFAKKIDEKDKDGAWKVVKGYSKKPFTPEVKKAGDSVVEKAAKGLTNFGKEIAKAAEKTLDKNVTFMGMIGETYGKAMTQGAQAIGKGYGNVLYNAGAAMQNVGANMAGMDKTTDQSERTAGAASKTATKTATKTAAKAGKSLGEKALKAAGMTVPGLREIQIVKSVVTQTKNTAQKVNEKTTEKAKRAAEQSAQTI